MSSTTPSIWDSVEVDAIHRDMSWDSYINFHHMVGCKGRKLSFDEYDALKDLIHLCMENAVK